MTDKTMTDEEHAEAVTEAWHMLNDSREKTFYRFWEVCRQAREAGLKIRTCEHGSIPVNGPPSISRTIDILCSERKDQ